MMRSSTLLLFTLAAAGAAGCVSSDADSGLRILRNIPPAANCAVEVEEDAFIPSGTIDAQSYFGYFFTPLVSNDLVLIEGETSVNKTIFVEGASISIHFYDEALFPRSSFDPALIDFLIPTSGSIEPSGGLATFGFEIVPAELLHAMSTTISEQDPGFRTVLDAQVQMFGTRGGGRVESNVFRYPVEVCVGCRKENIGPCEAVEEDYIPAAGSPCNPNQDGFLECCTLATGGEVCPARAPSGA